MDKKWVGIAGAAAVAVGTVLIVLAGGDVEQAAGIVGLAAAALAAALAEPAVAVSTAALARSAGPAWAAPAHI